MRILHISDLHIGKNFHGFSLIEDQIYALGRIVDLCREHDVRAAIIAGDVYDRSVPSGEAVTVLDDFLTTLIDAGVTVFLISGNHDGTERLQFASRPLERAGLYISAVYDGYVKRVMLSDEHGDVCFHLLPYISPYDTRRFFPDAEIRTHELAVRAALTSAEFSERNVLVTHQYVTDCYEGSVGGLDAVNASVFSRFDYVALGHVHSPYPVACERIRYSGSPLKYAFDEVGEQKGAVLVELDGSGGVKTEFLPIAPLHDLKEIRGTLHELMSAADDDGSYMHVTLTDKDDIPDAKRRISSVYERVALFDYDRAPLTGKIPVYVEDGKSTLDRFAEFFEMQTSRPIGEESIGLVKAALSEGSGIL